MTFYEAMERLTGTPAWSTKVGRTSDGATALIMDFTGVITHGSAQSTVKADYKTALIITKHLIEADNWVVLEENCKWDK